MDDSILNRRRFLAGASAGSGLFLAGCADQLGLGDGGQTDTPGENDGGTDVSGSDATAAEDEEAGPDGATDAAVAAIAAIDQQGLREEQMDIQRQVQSGEMDQEEAQQEMAAVQEEYISEAIGALTDRVEETEGVSVEDEYSSLGAVTLTGEAEAILGLLSSDDVSALVSAADVEARAAQQEEQG